MHILDCMGNTPLLRLERISRLLGANIYVKLESANPSLSHKDRVARAYLEGAMRRGELRKGGCVVEASSGNLGLALALACVKLDLRLLLCMPASVSRARRNLLHDLGAHVFVTPAQAGMRGAREKAAFRHADTWGSFRPDPWVNPDGPDCYCQGLGAELADSAAAQGLSLDAFVCAVGSGATLAGVGRCLRERNPRILLGAVSLAGDGAADTEEGVSSLLAGMPLSQKFCVARAEARQAQRKLLGMEGIRGGLSTGANLHAALLLAQQPALKGKNIFTLVHDLGEEEDATDVDRA